MKIDEDEGGGCTGNGKNDSRKEGLFCSEPQNPSSEGKAGADFP